MIYKRDQTDRTAVQETKSRASRKNRHWIAGIMGNKWVRRVYVIPDGKVLIVANPMIIPIAAVTGNGRTTADFVPANRDITVRIVRSNRKHRVMTTAIATADISVSMILPLISVVPTDRQVRGNA